MTSAPLPPPPSCTVPRPAPTRVQRVAAGRRQHGRIGTGGMIAWLLLAAAVVAGGAWWWRTHATSRTPTASTASAGTASAPMPQGGASAAPASPAGGERARKGGGGGGGAAGGSRAYYADRPTPVSVGDVKRQDVREIVNAIGTITAFNTVTVRTQVAGPLRAIHFKEGQEVKAGQLLAEIDPRPLQAALAQAQGTLAKDQAQVRNAQTDAKRYKDLLAKDSIARQQVDTQDALVRQLQGTIAVDQALVDSAKLQLSYTRITAPIGGRLGLRQVDVGNNIAPADANGIVSITQTRPINVTFAVPESKLAQLARQLGGITASGDPAKPLPVEAWNREQTLKLAIGNVSAMDNAVDAATGTIKVKARFDNADNLLFPNQFVNVPAADRHAGRRADCAGQRGAARLDRHVSSTACRTTTPWRCARSSPVWSTATGSACAASWRPAIGS